MDQNKIIEALRTKNVSEPCPRCATKSFSVVGESEIIVQREGKTLLTRLGYSMSLPLIIIACDNCGFISQHAQGALELSGNALSQPYTLKQGHIR